MHAHGLQQEHNKSEDYFLVPKKHALCYVIHWIFLCKHLSPPSALD